MLTGAGAVAFGFGAKIAVYLERVMGKRRFRVPFSLIALGLSILWPTLVVFALAVVACGFDWGWEEASTDTGKLHPMSGGCPPKVAPAPFAPIGQSSRSAIANN